MKSNSNSQETATAKPEQFARSNWVGLLVLSCLIAFVAYWMAQQGSSLDQAADQFSPSQAEPLTGYRAGLGQFSNDPMLGFVEIPAGPFLMGSNPAIDNQAYENERWSATQRQGQVDLEQFYIARFEVTVAQYQSFIAATGHPSIEQTLGALSGHPVSNITWTDALAYCRWLDSTLVNSLETPAEIKSLLDQGFRIKLPTEAQWEKSARGSQGMIYPWGNQWLDGRANFGSNSTVEVGSMNCADCNFGLWDMSGNVWEFTRSPYQAYPYREDDDRANLADDALWVMRGGGYTDSVANIRGAVRGAVDPGVRNNTIGFRIVLSR